MAKMSLWPGFHPDPAGRAHSAGFMGLTYRGRGWEGKAEERGGDVKGRGGEKGRGRRGREGREKGEGKGKDHIGTSFSHFKPWARVTG